MFNHLCDDTITSFVMGGFFLKKLIGMSMLIFLTVFNSFSIADDEMIELATIVEQYKGTIDLWEVTVKEQMNVNTLNELVRELQASKQQYKVTENNERSIHSFTHHNESTSIVETIEIIIPKQASQTGELIAILSSDTWNHSVLTHYRNHVQLLTKKYFTESSMKYTCLTTAVDDIINLGYLLKKLSNKLLFDDFYEQYDTVEESRYKKIIYAYSPLLDGYFESANQRMNFQMAIMNNNSEGIKCTIGTPILINEY